MPLARLEFSMSEDQMSAFDGSGGPPRKRSTKKPRELFPLRTDPLSSAQALDLLTSLSVVRDPLHGDIRVTRLEKRLIDTSAFQRLRRVRQLAMVDLVYPGAVHNRFLHSLGTLHICSEMMTNCRNTEKMFRPFAPRDHVLPVRITPYAELLARLVALMHDCAHVPFGHVFEREAQVFNRDEWEDPFRTAKIFGTDGDFARSMEQYFVKHFADFPEGSMDERTARNAAQLLLADVMDVVTAKKGTVHRLRYPFVADLVGNTICADLLDYVQRDMYYAGLTEGFGQRFLKHLAIIPTDFDVPNELDEFTTGSHFTLRPYRGPDYGREALQTQEVSKNHIRQCRVVLLLYRYNERGIPSSKYNVLPEAIDLIRRRKLVAEKLYFHKNKLAATAMLAAAAYASGITDAERIWEMSDDEVLQGIANGTLFRSGSSPQDQTRRKRAQILATKLLRRDLLKPVYRIGYYRNDDGEPARRLWDEGSGAYDRYRTSEKREGLIAALERVIGLSLTGDEDAGIGLVAISCPNKDMQLKAFEMMVMMRNDAPTIQPLEETARQNVRDEINVIQRGHEELWNLEVLVAPEVLTLSESFQRKLVGAIEQEIGVPNELTPYRNVEKISLDEFYNQTYFDHHLSELGVRQRIPEPYYRQLVTGQIAARGTDELRTHLIEWGLLAPDPE
jgi:hypothetical protein